MLQVLQFQAFPGGPVLLSAVLSTPTLEPPLEEEDLAMCAWENLTKSPKGSRIVSSFPCQVPIAIIRNTKINPNI